ncbi:hypothetical protein TNCV_826201 [Trichonephila clavipes]|nr:hypothetical protein TNCV_826201 [Trichonephila clavipes]
MVKKRYVGLCILRWGNITIYDSSVELIACGSKLTNDWTEPMVFETVSEGNDYISNEELQDLLFDDYAQVDTDIVIWGTLFDAESVALDHNNTESQEIKSEELTPINLIEAKGITAFTDRNVLIYQEVIDTYTNGHICYPVILHDCRYTMEETIFR